MGPIGCLFGLVAQIIHIIVLIISLPFVLIAAIFKGGKKDD